jgi:ribosomal protein S27AE
MFLDNLSCGMNDLEHRRQQQREAQRRYYKRHPERAKEACRAWREKNRGYSTRYYQANAEKEREQARERSKTTAYKIRKAAQQRVRTAVRRGRLTQSLICSECGRETTLHKHHDDYTKPLDVRWLCPDCHVELHAKRRSTT